MESVLGRIRNRELKPVPELITVLLDGADILRSMVNDIENSEETDITPIINSLEPFYSSKEPSRTIGKDSAVISELYQFRAPFTGELLDIDLACIYEVQQTARARFIFLLEIDVENDSVAKGRSEEEFLSEIQGIVPIISTKAISVENGAGKYFLVLCGTSIDKSVIMECFTLPAERVSPVLSGMIVNVKGQFSLSGVTQNCCIKSGKVPQQSDFSPAISIHHSNDNTTVASAQTHEKKPDKSIQENSLRVSIHTLDKLMTLAGEMVLTRNELLQSTTTRNMEKILATSQRVDSITSELQEAIMSTRMQSIGVVLNKFRRLVRDLAGQLEKKVHLEIEGEDVELDKSILEAVADPLTHIVRNAVDHGIELPSVRMASGKPPAGNLKIKASHEAGHVVIQIIDDGKGMDPVVIRKKAITMGIAAPIITPGFEVSVQLVIAAITSEPSLSMYSESGTLILMLFIPYCLISGSVMTSIPVSSGFLESSSLTG
jgi:two-component system chemotaxis sensor kinase CheA